MVHISSAAVLYSVNSKLKFLAAIEIFWFHPFRWQWENSASWSIEDIPIHTYNIHIQKRPCICKVSKEEKDTLHFLTTSLMFQPGNEIPFIYPILGKE